MVKIAWFVIFLLGTLLLPGKAYRIGSSLSIRPKMRLFTGSEVSADLIKTLRERTGAGFSNCKSALLECNGDITAAIELMRKKGTAVALKKGTRSVSSGLIGVSVSGDGRTGGMVEINSETDFVTRNDIFVNLVSSVASTVANNAAPGNTPDVNWANTLKVSAAGQQSPETVQQSIVNAIAIVGENMVLNRVCQVSVESGLVASYVHNSFKENTGKIGVLLGLSTTSPQSDALINAARLLCLHVAAQSPEVIRTDQVSAAALDRFVCFTR